MAPVPDVPTKPEHLLCVMPLSQYLGPGGGGPGGKFLTDRSWDQPPAVPCIEEGQPMRKKLSVLFWAVLRPRIRQRRIIMKCESLCMDHIT